jgi:alpha-N-arabinofuranosidase
MLKRCVLVILFLLIASLALATVPTVGSVAVEQATILVDAAEVTDTIHSLQGINAGPRRLDPQHSHLFRQYEDIGVDYVRTHDYYGPADMRVLFPDLQADPDDESSYDFTSTDRELEAINRVGAEILFRLGESWGSPVTYVAPQDHAAWAQAAVHVAKHYNDGWADGFHWDVEYWEVWNEPDIQFWTGTPEEYYQLYEAAARALKAYDPTLKVGGPGLCCQNDFLKGFLAYCRDHDVPLDFVSWHYYGGPTGLLERAVSVQQALDTYGFTDAENLLTEWNISVEADFEHLRDATGAAYTALVLSHLQDTSVTIANRYRGDGGLGMFNSEGLYTKPAYSFLAFHWMLDTTQRLATEAPLTYNWSAIAGRGETSEVSETSEVWAAMVQILISNYASSHASFDLTVDNLPWGVAQPYRYERYLLDETHDLTLVESADVPAGSSSFTTTEAMAAPSVQLIRLFVPAGEATPRITVHADQTSDPISPLLYGLNHRYLHSGYGVWDAEEEQVHPEVISRSLEIGFPVTRFPGGTVGGTYHWTDGIGPLEERPTGISGFDGAPATNEYGFDEHTLFMEQVGATTNVVVNFGTGTAQEAAAWVAYANGDPADTTPIGVDELGVDWGTVGEWATHREANQMRLGMSPHPYDIRYWEVGNELYGDWEYSWTHGPIKYALGGTAWQYDQPVVKENDWRDSVSRSSGQPSQVFYLRYPPVVTATQTIIVSGVAWTEVPDLSVAGQDDNVYEFDPQQGEIRFGDGVHGRIPPLAAPIRASYESGPHDGFVDYYAAMKAVDPDIKVGSCFYTDIFLQTMGEEHPYDFLAVHPYYSSGGRGGNGLAEAHLRTMAGPLIKQMDLEDLQAAVRLYARERADQVEIAITEYNLYVRERESPTPHYGMSLDQGLFVADMLRVLIAEDIPLGDLHCLISLGEGEGWDNTAVMSPYPELIPRPAAYVLQLLNQHFAPVQVDSEVEDAPLLTGSVPALEVVASTDEANERLTLLAINKETNTPITATVAVGGFNPASEATVWTLTGPDIAAFNDRGHPTDVSITESAIANADQSFVYAFPAHSVTLIELVAASSHPTPTPTATPTCTATPTSTPTSSPTVTSRSRLYLPLILKDYTPTTPTPTPTPTSTPTPSAEGIVLADRAGGLELISAPVAISITVGHVTYLPVEVQGYHRPITVTAQTLIHTYVNDVTPVEPGDSALLAVGTLQTTQNELKLQTLRMRSHSLTLSFSVKETRFLGRAGDVVSITLTLKPVIQPRTPLFGIHASLFYDGLPQPYIRVWGPDCSPCLTTPDDPPGSTRDLACAKHLEDSCRCHPIQEIFDHEADARVREQAPEMQRYASHFLRSIGGWGSLQIAPGDPPQYLWDGLDWLFNSFSAQERDYSPLFSGIMSGDFGWMTCSRYTNPDGSVGFFDPNNAYLMEQYRLHVRDVATRYAPELRFFETANEPCYGFYLCPCLDDPAGPAVACNAASGPNQYVCDFLTQPYGHESEEFAQVYGPFLSESANAASEELAAANPEAILVAGALEKSRTGLTATTRYMIEHGLLDRGNVAVMIHQFPYPSPPDWIKHEPCVYGPGYYLPPGCETAPPMEDYTTPAGRPVSARAKWQEMDEAMDVGEILHDADQLGVLDRFYLFDTELHAGFYVKDETTTTGRATIAGLRVGAINSHQRFVGMEFIGANDDPTAYNLMVKHLAGATPVYAWDAPLTDTDYSGLVYKLFTRGHEDIIALWSNAEAPQTLTLTPSVEPTEFKQVTLTRFVAPRCADVRCSDARDQLDITTEELDAPPATITVWPLYEFYFLSVISDRPGFGWLADLTSSPSQTPTPTPTSTSTPSSTPTSTPTITPSPLPTPTPTPTSTGAAIVLAERAGGLELVSAPVTLSLTVGHITYLPVEVQNYHRPITVTVQTLIHTYVNDVTPGEPGDSPHFNVGTLDGPRNELQLQTLRLRPHSLTLSFSVEQETRFLGENGFLGRAGDVVSTTLTLEPVIQPRTSLFGVHSTPFYDGLPAPFIRVWGPDCGSCPTTPGDPPGSTRDLGCAKALNDTCHCHPFQEVFDSEADARVRERAPEQQRYASHFVRSIGGWGSIQHQPGQYLWQGLDWLFDDLSPQERDYSPLFSGIMDGNFGWMTCPEYTNPDGSIGFFDPDNVYLVEQYRANVRVQTERYAPELRFVELSNEPAAEYYLCPCVAPGGTCDATTGPNQPACLLGPNSPEFVATYGDLLFTAADAAAEELALSAAEGMAIANPDALEITGALDLPPNDFGLSLTTEYMITRSLLTHDNVAIGIHQYPYLNPPNWISPTLNCAYYQVPGDPYWLPPGCETAPPFEDYVTPAGRPIPARYTWQRLDERVDVSNLLHDADGLGVLDRIYFFDTELHAGWHDGDSTTTPAREAMAGLRIGSINAHQRVLGSEFVFAPTDPTAYNLLVKHLAGATPAYAWDAPLMDADYSGLVYKLFTRGDEDIIALWSNAEEYQQLALPLAAEPTQFKQVTLTSFETVLPRADEPERLAIFTESKSMPPESILVRPIKQFYFLSVISDRPGFGWLADITSSPSQTPTLTPTSTSTPSSTPTPL